MITLGIASIPNRVNSLEKVLDSLTGQVDQMNIVLNGYKTIPGFLNKYKNAWWMLADNSKGDAMKFYKSDTCVDYYVSWDDDLVATPNLIAYLIDKCKEHDCPASLHGKRFTYPCTSIYRPTQVFHCRKEVKGDHIVDMIGTGCLCFDTSQIVISMKDFPLPNMSDLYFSLQAKKQGVPLMVVAHPANAFQYLEQSWTIWKDDRHPEESIKLINEIMKPK
jgi:hypothetical protein